MTLGRSFTRTAVLALVLSSSFIFVPRSGIASTVTVLKCNCNSLAELQSVAEWNWQYGAVALVSSEINPISAYFRMGYMTYWGEFGTPVDIPYAYFLTVGEENAGKLDNEVYARAAKLDPVEIPPEVGGSGTTPEVVQSWLTSQAGPFAVLPGQGHSVWHMIANWGHSGFYYNVLDKRTGETQRVYMQDTVELRFEDGTTWQVEFLGPLAPTGAIFKKIDGRERDANGDPITGSIGGSPSTPGGSAIIIANLLEREATPTNYCTILVSTSVCEGYGEQCWGFSRLAAVPCPW